MSASPITVRVLHVDDDRDLRDLVAVALEQEDDRFEVLTAGGPDAGLDVLADERVDCVVSDYDMPGTNGIEFLEAVRTEYPDLPFILYTGKGSEEVASEAISAGVTDYLQKGTGTDQYALLANRIDNAVSAAHSREALAERNRRLETLISNLPGIVYRCRNEPEWPMEFVAGECEAVTGYTAAQLEAGDVSWGQEVLHPDDRDRMWDQVQSALDAGDPFEVTYRVRTADGEVRWMWERGRAIGTDPERIEGFITDVTERREREQTLERYRTMVDAMPASACIYDAEGHFAVVNEYLADFFGTTAAELEGTESALVELIREEADDGDPFAELVAGEREAVRGEVEGEFPGHGRAVVDYRLARLEIDGEFDGVVGVARDVTEHRERERRLAATSARLEALVENSPDMVDVLDADGRIVEANQRLQTALGYDEDDLVGRPIWEIDTTVDRSDVASFLADLAVDEARKFDGEYRRADGSTVPVEVHLVRIDLRGEDRYLAISRDISERKRREDALSALTEAVERFMDAPDEETVAEHAVETATAVLDHDIVGVWMADNDASTLTPVAATEAARDRVGPLPTYGGGESITWTAFQRGAVTVCEDLASEPDRYNPDTPLASEIVLPLGEYGVLVAGTTEPATFDDVDVSIARVFANTVEAALDRAARERESREHRRELERQNERLDEFAGVVSHDLRNPLQVATARAEFLEDEVDSEHLDAVQRAHDRMAALIDDLLTLGREGKTVLDIEPVALGEVARDCWGNVGTSTARLRVETDASVRADRRRLQQLLENLLGNAVEHGSTSPASQARQDAVEHGSTSPRSHAPEDADGASSVEPSVADAPEDAVEHGSTSSRPQAAPEPDTPTVEEHASDGGDESVTVRVGALDDGDGFFVADDGPGIPESERADVFASGYSTDPEGTGFGLSIVEQIADAHGWSVRVTDRKFGGATGEQGESGSPDSGRAPGARFEVTGVDITD